MKNKKFIVNASTEELISIVDAVGEKKFRVRQIQNWIFQHWITEPDQMKNLSLSLRNALKDVYCSPVAVQKETISDQEGTSKVLFELSDGECIESVCIPAPPDRSTFCISSQVGCPVKCRFCASGAHGLIRNLNSAEIIEQFFQLALIQKRLPTNLVFMGIGEPLLNFDQVAQAIHLLTAEDGVNFSPRRITVSTSGWTPGILQLTKLDKPFYLALSLHATDDYTRSLLIPDTFRRPISEILTACREFAQQHNRLVTLEYALIDGINDSEKQAYELAEIAIDLNAKINIIPYNPVAESAFKRPSLSKIHQFVEVLNRRRAKVMVRYEKGGSVRAACGQLRAQHHTT